MGVVTTVIVTLRTISRKSIAPSHIFQLLELEKREEIQQKSTLFGR